MTTIDPRTVTFVYRNHNRIVNRRFVVPEKIEYAACPYHEGVQWVLHAFDINRQALRTFAIKDILSTIEPATEELYEQYRRGNSKA